MITAKVDKKGRITSKIKKKIVSENTLIEHETFICSCF